LIVNRELPLNPQSVLPRSTPRSLPAPTGSSSSLTSLPAPFGLLGIWFESIYF
jgi:hypothetical protein